MLSEQEDEHLVSAAQTDAKTKTVRFSDERNTILEFENGALLFQHRVWYQAGQYAEMKARSRSDAREARKLGIGCLLSCTFDSPRPDAQVTINAFVRYGEHETRRGLERFLCRDHGDERVDGKDRARSSVIVHQRRLKKESLSEDDVALTLAAIYGEAVYNASVFARRLGMADALVVKEGEDSSMAEEYMEAYLKQKKKRHATIERRLSNSNYSVQSVGSNYSVQSVESQASMDSRRRIPLRLQGKTRVPASPASPSEEFYAAIA